MKTCAYCGRENVDQSRRCAECGNSEFKALGTLPANEAITENQRSKTELRDILSDPSRFFRALVVVSTVTYLIWFFHNYLFGQFISDETHAALSWQGYGALFRLPESFKWLSMLLFIALAIGLWNFSKSARLVFTSLLAFFAFTSLFQGLATETAFSWFLAYISNLADGAILVMAYTSPLKNKFT